MKQRAFKRVRMPKRGGGPNIGNRCKEDAPGCIVCDSWAFKNCFGRFPFSFDELTPFRRKALE